MTPKPRYRRPLGLALVAFLAFHLPWVSAPLVLAARMLWADDLVRVPAHGRT